MPIGKSPGVDSILSSLTESHDIGQRKNFGDMLTPGTNHNFKESILTPVTQEARRDPTDEVVNWDQNPIQEVESNNYTCNHNKE